MSCAAKKRYIDLYGRPPERVVLKCGICEKEFSDYATNRTNKKNTKNKHGLYFCSIECRRVWAATCTSMSGGGGGDRQNEKDNQKWLYRKNADARRESSRNNYWKNRDEILAKKKAKSRETKLMVINAYGGVCECCGESMIEFLTIDHINNNGAEHRKRVGKGVKIYDDLIKQGLPQGEYRVLCFNCNITRGFYGYCPHKPNDISPINHIPNSPGRKRSVK